MELFISAQDIQRITFGLVQDQALFFEKTFEAAPEQYLLSLDTFLSEQKLSSTDVSRIMIVNGPGSFTASRVSVTIANTLAFARSIPIVSFENPDRLSLTELLMQIGSREEQVFAVPAYDRPPNIT